jgi:hypothetical protein
MAGAKRDFVLYLLLRFFEQMTETVVADAS